MEETGVCKTQKKIMISNEDKLEYIKKHFTFTEGVLLHYTVRKKCMEIISTKSIDVCLNGKSVEMQPAVIVWALIYGEIRKLTEIEFIDGQKANFKPYNLRLKSNLCICGVQKLRTYRYCDKCCVKYAEKNLCKCGKEKNVKQAICKSCTTKLSIINIKQRLFCGSCGNEKESGTRLCKDCKEKDRLHKKNYHREIIARLDETYLKMLLTRKGIPITEETLALQEAMLKLDRISRKK